MLASNFFWKHKWPELPYYWHFDWSWSVEAVALYNIYVIYVLYIVYYEKMFIRVVGIYIHNIMIKAYKVLIFHTDIQRWYKFPIMQHYIVHIYI